MGESPWIQWMMVCHGFMVSREVINWRIQSRIGDPHHFCWSNPVENPLPVAPWSRVKRKASGPGIEGFLNAKHLGKL